HQQKRPPESPWRWPRMSVCPDVSAVTIPEKIVATVGLDDTHVNRVEISSTVHRRLAADDPGGRVSLRATMETRELAIAGADDLKATYPARKAVWVIRRRSRAL